MAKKQPKIVELETIPQAKAYPPAAEAIRAKLICFLTLFTKKQKVMFFSGQ